MNIKTTILVVSLVFLSGCAAQRLMHQPQEYTEQFKSKEVIEKVLYYQSPNHAIRSVYIRPDYIRIISTAHNRTTYIHFEYINKFELHAKDEWRIVTLRGPFNDVIYRLYVKDEQMARDFINAVYTLKVHQNDDVQPSEQ